MYRMHIMRSLSPLAKPPRSVRKCISQLSPTEDVFTSVFYQYFTNTRGKMMVWREMIVHLSQNNMWRMDADRTKNSRNKDTKPAEATFLYIKYRERPDS